MVDDVIIGDNITSLHSWATENCTDSTMNQTTNSVPVTQEYFDNVLLKKTSGIEEVLRRLHVIHVIPFHIRSKVLF